MRWKGKIINWLIEELKSDDEWSTLYKKLIESDTLVGVHLAIFSEPYLTLLLDGKKKIESRFSIKNVSPFGKVNSGDFVLVKRAGGPVIAGFTVNSVKYFTGLNFNKMMQLDREFGKLICTEAEDSFWQTRIDAKYGTLLYVGEIKQFSPFETGKSDRTAWTVIRHQSASLFD